jgi:hypothetical protein
MSRKAREKHVPAAQEDCMTLRVKQSGQSGHGKLLVSSFVHKTCRLAVALN